MNPNKTARIAGSLYLLMMPLAVFGILYIPSVLVVPGDAEATLNNILASSSVFRLSIVSALIVQLGHLFIVLLLYKLLKPVNINLASLMVIFLLVSIPITMFNELNHIAVMLLSNGADYGKVLTADQSTSMVPLFLDLHGYGILVSSIFWGLWLCPMGYLVLKSGFLPKILGILLLIACFCYLTDSFGRLLFPGFDGSIIATIIGIGLYGEILFPLWLVIKGVKVEKWNKVAGQFL